MSKMSRFTYLVIGKKLDNKLNVMSPRDIIVRGGMSWPKKEIRDRILWIASLTAATVQTLNIVIPWIISIL